MNLQWLWNFELKSLILPQLFLDPGLFKGSKKITFH